MAPGGRRGVAATRAARVRPNFEDRASIPRIFIFRRHFCRQVTKHGVEFDESAL